jgi:negative regulator of flagellin synthesis FlgM
MANDIPFISKTSTRSTANGKGMDSAKGLRSSADNVVALNEKTEANKVKQNQEVETKSKDSVKLTDAAKHIQALTKAAKDSTGVDLEKVERIKRQLEEGKYPLDADTIARNILELNALIDPPPGIQRPSKDMI